MKNTSRRVGRHRFFREGLWAEVRHAWSAENVSRAHRISAARLLPFPFLFSVLVLFLISAGLFSLSRRHGRFRAPPPPSTVNQRPNTLTVALPSNLPALVGAGLCSSITGPLQPTGKDAETTHAGASVRPVNTDRNLFVRNQ